MSSLLSIFFWFKKWILTIMIMSMDENSFESEMAMISPLRGKVTLSEFLIIARKGFKI